MPGRTEHGSQPCSKPPGVVSNPMRNFVQLICVCMLLSYDSDAQLNDSADVMKFYSDSSLSENLNLLTKFDSTDRFALVDCEAAADIVGDIYFQRSAYSKALAYYDSADSKYRNRAVFCGNGYFLYMIPRRYKSALCYIELQRPDLAIRELTPYMFDEFSQTFIDSSILQTYILTVRSVYSKEKLTTELALAFDSAQYYHSYGSKFGPGTTMLNIVFKFRIFGTEIRTVDISTSAENEIDCLYCYTKQAYFDRIRKTKIYTILFD